MQIIIILSLSNTNNNFKQSPGALPFLPGKIK